MFTDDDLKRLARQPESDVIERKQSRQTREIRVALVAFANSVRHAESAVIFIGIGPRGEIVGVERPDEDQREIRKIAEQDCYPPIECQITVVSIDDKAIIAVMIPHSTVRPHFAGHAYVRVGSESVKSSDAMMDALIASRNDKASRLQEMIGKNVLIELRPSKPWSQLNGRQPVENRFYKILSCDAHSVTIEDVMHGPRIVEPLSQVELLPIAINGCSLKLLILNPNHAPY